MKYTAAHWGAYEINGDDIKAVKDDPSPSRIGKSWVSAAKDKQTRILRPAVRKGWLDGDRGQARCDDAYVEISWDKAAKLVADEITRVRTDFGNGAIYGGSYGWASAGRFHHAQSQLRRFLNLAGGCVSSSETYSHAAAEVLFPHITGMSQYSYQENMTSWPLIAEHCTLLVAFGGISGRTAQVTSSGAAAHETENWLEKCSARQVNIAPRRSDMPKAEWISIRPGTDVALMLGLCHTLLAEGLHDRHFIDRYTSGWPYFVSNLQGIKDGQVKNSDWAARVCGVPASTIRQLARDMAKNKTMISVAWSLQRADHGEQAVFAGFALAAMLGQIGQPGAGFGFGYSGVGSVGRPSKITRWPSLPQGKNPIDDFIPVARIADMLLHPRETYPYNGQVRTYPDIHMVLWSGGNPFHHHQDLNRLEQAWRKPETVVALDHSWTATARRTDIVLPATSPLERHDIMMSKTDPALIYMSPMFEPLEEAKDDHEILRLIAAELGFEKEFTEGRDTEGWLRWLWEGAKKVGAERDVAMPDFESFREAGRFDMPDSYEERIALSDFIADPDANPLKTESGRLTVFNEAISDMELEDCPGGPSWVPPVESLLNAPEGGLHLISAQPDTRLHSQNDRGAESVASKLEGREICHLHPEAAKERGIEEGTFVRIYNARGATLAGVAFDSDMRDDCIALPTGAWLDIADVDGERLDVHGNPNVLTIDKGASSLTQGNIAHTAVVFAEPWDKPLPPLTVDKPPRILVD